MMHFLLHMPVLFCIWRGKGVKYDYILRFII